MRIKQVGYYWVNLNKKGKLIGKIYRNWEYFKWESGSWVWITHKEWCAIAQMLTKLRKNSGERNWEEQQIKLPGRPPKRLTRFK